MENNWSKHFMYNDSVDQYTQTASTIFNILKDPKSFIETVGLDESSLMDEKECIHIIINWLRAKVE